MSLKQFFEVPGENWAANCSKPNQIHAKGKMRDAKYTGNGRHDCSLIALRQKYVETRHLWQF